MKEKRLASLKEQTHYQNIYKKWIWCDNMVAITTAAGFALVLTYHIVAIHYLIDYCSQNNISKKECKKHLLFDRYNEI